MHNARSGPIALLPQVSMWNETFQCSMDMVYPTPMQPMEVFALIQDNSNLLGVTAFTADGFSWDAKATADPPAASNVRISAVLTGGPVA
jgi:hypothetical protein